MKKLKLADNVVMKILLLFLFSMPLTVFSQTCEELEEDLLSIEYDLLSSKLDLCDPSGGPQINCRFGNSNNKTYAEVLQDYNKAMAKLVLHNGIEAITAATGGSNNSLATITPEKIDKAKEYIDVLEESLTKAEMLEAAMTPVDGSDGAKTSFWSKYEINENSDFDTFRNNLESGCIQKNELLCQKLTELGVVRDQDSKPFQTLYAYMQAESRVRVGDASNPESFYNEQKDKLRINVTDSKSKINESLTPSKYREKYFGVNGSMKKMRDSILAFEANRTNPRLKSEVIANAAKLDTISTSYAISNQGDDGSSSYALTVNGSLNKNLQKPLIDLQMNLTDNLTTDIWKTNLSKNVERVNEDQFVFQQGIIEGMKRLANSSEFMRKACSDYDSSEECIVSECALSAGNTTCKNEKIRIQGAGELDSLILQMKDAEKLAKLSTDFEKAEECFDKAEFDEKKECLIDGASKLGYAYEQTSKQKLINDVEAAKKEMERYNSSSPFKGMKDNKILAIAAIEINECVGKTNVVLENTCQESAGSRGLDEGAIELSQNLGNVAIRLNRRLVNDAKGRSVASTSRTEIDNQRTKSFREKCENGKEKNLKNLCNDYSKRNREETLARDKERQENAYRVDRARAVEYYAPQTTKVKKPSVIGNGLRQGLLTPNIVTGKTALETALYGGLGYYQTRQYVKSERNKIAAGVSIFDAQQAFLQANQPIYSDAFAFTNPFTGERSWNHNGAIYNSDFQFQQASLGNLFVPQSPLAFNFQSSFPNSTGLTTTPTSVPGTISTPTLTPTPTPTTVPQTNFEFQI